MVSVSLRIIGADGPTIRTPERAHLGVTFPARYSAHWSPSGKSFVRTVALVARELALDSGEARNGDLRRVGDELERWRNRRTEPR